MRHCLVRCWTHWYVRLALIDSTRTKCNILWRHHIINIAPVYSKQAIMTWITLYALSMYRSIGLCHESILILSNARLRTLNNTCIASRQHTSIGQTLTGEKTHSERCVSTNDVALSKLRHDFRTNATAGWQSATAIQRLSKIHCCFHQGHRWPLELPKKVMHSSALAFCSRFIVPRWCNHTNHKNTIDRALGTHTRSQGIPEIKRPSSKQSDEHVRHPRR